MRFRVPVAIAAMALVLAACASSSPSPSASTEASTLPTESEAATPSPEETTAATGSPGAGEMISVFDIQEGDCVNIPEDVDIVEQVELVDCAVPHDYEVYSTFDVAGGPGDAYPGDESVKTAAEDQCPVLFEPFVGMNYQESELYIYYLAPSVDTWAEGDREIVCALYLPNEHLTGSMEGSNR